MAKNEKLVNEVVEVEVGKNEVAARTVIEVYMNSFYNAAEMEVANKLTNAKASNKVVKFIGSEIKRLQDSKYKREFINEHSKEKAKELRAFNKEINARIKELRENKKEIKVSMQDMMKLQSELEKVVAGSDTKTKRKLNLVSNEIYVNKYNSLLEETDLLTEESRYKVRTIEDCTKNNTWAESSLIRAVDSYRKFEKDDFIIINRGNKLNDVVFRQIVKQGFEFGDTEYIFFSSSASELKNGQATFIKKELNEKIKMTLSCGLTLKRINQLGGMNTNKYMSYKSLAKSSSKKWVGFNIDEAIVVPDIEFIVKGKKVDYIHHQTLEQQLEGKMPENADTIERKTMDIPYNFTDGMGITSDKTVTNRIVRFPWGKGLLTYDNFKNYIRNAGCKGHIEDLWGKKHSMTDFKNGEIKYIFFESMFKMAKYFPNEVDETGKVVKYGWDIYKENFKKYNCEMAIVEQEPNKLKGNRRLNYQMIQQLNAVATDEEIKQLSEMSLNSIGKIGNNLDTTLRLFGAVDSNENMTPFQKSLLRYKPLMKSNFMKEKMTSLKASRVKEFKAGRLEFDSVMTFVVPDISVINQWLFSNIRDIYQMKDILDENEVICDSFKAFDKVDVLRSPSLGFEHNVMKVVAPDKKEKSNYYKTRAIYTSAKSLLSKVIFFDNDGDKLYVVKNDILCNMVTRFKEKYKLVPLYFDMEKAPAIKLNKDSFTNGMLSAFGVSIGEWSNPISKLWDELNNESKQEDVSKTLELINLFVMYNNFAIDSSKTNFIPTMTEYVAEQQKKYKSVHTHLPHFFKYAKDKDNVKEIGLGFVDKLEGVYKTNRNNFTWKMTDGFNKTEYNESMVMSKDTKVEDKTSETGEKILSLLKDKDAIKSKESFMEKAEVDIDTVVDTLVRYRLSNDITWNLFGQEICNNVTNKTSDKMKICPECGAYFEYKTDDKKCKKCR